MCLRDSIKSIFIFLVSTAFVLSLFFQTKLIARAATSVNLTVNAGIFKNKFTRDMLGVGFVNWEHAWGKPFLNSIPSLKTALNEIKPGILRYAGGLWANSVGWDRTKQRTPYTNWQYPGDSSTYAFHYGSDEIDSLAAFASSIGSQVMIQVNIANNNPQMWADMVKYSNVEKKYGFKYWELGNELDHDTGKNVSPAEYAQRAVAYEKAMHAVDPSIHIIYGVPAYTVPQNDAATTLSGFLLEPAKSIKAVGKTVDSESYHWYQGCNMTAINDVTQYAFQGIPSTSWRNAYARNWANIIPKRVKTEALKDFPNATVGITELNVDACNYDNKGNANQIGGVWYSDVLGRLAYNGLDYVTMYEGYGEQAYAMINSKGGIKFSSLFYTAYLYSKFFGSQMVETISSNDNVSIWATKDGNSLKLIVNNLSDQQVDTKISLNGYTTSGSTAQLYELKPDRAVTASTGLNTDINTTINGTTLTTSNITSAVAPKSIAVSGNSINYSLSGYSSAAIIVGDGVTPSTSPSVSPTGTATVTQSPSVTPTSASCVKHGQGDGNCDNTIDLLDFELFRSEFLEQRKGTLNISIAKADFNDDKSIDLIDFELFRAGYISQKSK